jgi:hypothetical protein
MFEGSNRLVWADADREERALDERYRISGLARPSASLTRTAQTATAVNLAFVLAAWLCAFGLPRTLGAERAEENT